MPHIRLPILPPGTVYAPGSQTHLWIDVNSVAAIDPMDRPLNGLGEPACMLHMYWQPIALRIALPADTVAALLGWTDVRDA